MNISCDKCGKRYVIADDKLAGKAAPKIRCKACGTLISVGVGSSPSTPGVAVSSASGLRSASSPGLAPPQSAQWGENDEDERTRAMPKLDLSAQWYAMVAGQQAGPFDLSALKSKVDGGEVTLRTYLWKPGMGDWKRASDLPEMSPIFAGVDVAAAAKPAPARDVVVAAQVPAPEVTTRPATPSGGTGAVAQPQASAPLNDLFNDMSQDVGGQVTAAPGEAPDANAKPDDPFAQLGGGESGQLPPPGEATKFFIAQAGVNKRNPPWKIALFGISIVALPTAALFALSTLHVIPPVTRVNERGEEVQESFFSPEGMSGLKDMLTGEGAKKKAEAEAKRRAAAAAEEARRKAALAGGPGPGTAKPDEVKKDPTGLTPEQMKELMGDSPGTIGGKVPKDRNAAGTGTAAVNSSGLTDEAALKVINANRKGFESCIENALRRNPNLAAGNITLRINIGQSGAVKGADVEPKKHSGTDWAQCMSATAKRIVFPAADEETQLDVPFKVGVSM